MVKIGAYYLRVLKCQYEPPFVSLVELFGDIQGFARLDGQEPGDFAHHGFGSLHKVIDLSLRCALFGLEECYKIAINQYLSC